MKKQLSILTALFLLFSTSILQALTLMNGDLVDQAATRGKSLAAAMARSGQTPTHKVEALYLAALGRTPRPRELQRALRHIEAGGSGDIALCYGDVLWALLNSIEFRTNH